MTPSTHRLRAVLRHISEDDLLTDTADAAE